MSNLVVSQTASLARSLSIASDDTGELVAVLKATAFKGQVTDAQMTALLVVANQYGLNPWTKEIYAFPDRNNGIVPVVGVDGWSRIINSHPMFDGMEFEQDDESCTCIIYRKDRSHAIRVTEWMAECLREGVGPWKSHPKRMLRHKAMIQCARLAFGFVGIYEQDEAERILEAEASPVRTSGKHSSAVQQPEDSEQRSAMVKTLRDVAALGTDKLKVEWERIGKEGRTMVGATEWEAIKAIAASADITDAEFTDATEAGNDPA